jgi:hypothetical protein
MQYNFLKAFKIEKIDIQYVDNKMIILNFNLNDSLLLKTNKGLILI